MKPSPIICSIIVFVICCSVLFFDGGRGLSDNGDFARVMSPMGIDFVQSDSDSKYYFGNIYRLSDTGDIEYTSTHFIPIYLSKVLNAASNKLNDYPIDRYNIYWLGMVYTLLFCVATYLITDFVRGLLRRSENPKPLGLLWLFIAAFVFVFCDEGYILYFNSFYGEAFSYVLFMLMLAFYLKVQNGGAGYVVLYYMSVFLFGGSKLANLPIAVVFALLGLTHTKTVKGPVVYSSFLLCVTLCGYIFSTIPDWMERDTTYHSVFYGVLRASNRPKDDLVWLGISPDYAVLQNTTAYLPEYPIDVYGSQFQQDFNVSKVRVGMYYLTHPNRLLEKMNIALDNSAIIRPAYLGNTKDAPVEFSKRFSLWSNARLILTPIFFVPLVLICLFGFKDKLTCCIALCALMNWVIPFIANGEADLAKHMFAFIHMCDIIFFIVLVKVASNFKQCWIFFTSVLICLSLSLSAPTDNRESRVFGGMHWKVVSYESDILYLLYDDETISMPFDNSSNLWTQSLLREWLNQQFIKNFSAEEVDKMVLVDNITVLSKEHTELMEGGRIPFYWSYDQGTSDYGYEDSYYITSSEKVFIPDIRQVKTFGITTEKPMIMRTPFYGNGSMIRYLDKYQHSLHTSVSKTLEIKPMIAIQNDASAMEGMVN